MNTAGLKQAADFAFQSLNHLIWPLVCINCREAICDSDRYLCKKCWSQLLASTAADHCRRCGRDASKYALLDGACGDCPCKDMYFDRIASGGRHEKTLRKMILAFKHQGRTELDSMLAFLANAALQGSGFYNDIDMFVPVPLHWTRRLSRGYNQAKLIVGKLKHSSAKINTDLVRVRRTAFQPSMATTASRAKNVAGAFSVRYRHEFAGKNVCLVDDVKTTGATLNECAKALKQAGAKKVYALVLSVAGQNIS